MYQKLSFSVPLECHTSVTTCSVDEKPLFYITSTQNSHVWLNDPYNMLIKVCCKYVQDVALKDSCDTGNNEEALMFIYDPYSIFGSHIADSSIYNKNLLCLKSVWWGKMDCYITNENSCPSGILGYGRVGGMYDRYNSHYESPESSNAPYSICCKVRDVTPPNLWVDIFPNPAMSDSFVGINVTCQDAGSGCKVTSLNQSMNPEECAFTGEGDKTCSYPTPHCIYGHHTFWAKSEDYESNTNSITGSFVVKKADGCACTFDEECYSGMCINGVCMGSIENSSKPELFVEPEMGVVLGRDVRISVKIRNPNLVPDIIITQLSIKPQIPWKYWIYFTGHKYDEQAHTLRIYFKPNEEKIIHFTVEANQLTYGVPVRINITAKSQNFQLDSEPAEIKINVIESQARPAYPSVSEGINIFHFLFMAVISAILLATL